MNTFASLILEHQPIAARSRRCLRYGGRLSSWAAACLLIAGGSWSCAASPKHAPETAAQPTRVPRPELRQPTWLPPEAREMLTRRMLRHAQDMSYLVNGVVLLEHDVVLELSERMAAEPRLGRPAPGEQGTLGALLPSRFFDLEDELRERARALGEAARAKDDTGLVHAYGQLVGTCVSCHALYLQDDVAADDGRE
jgi:hypothetical protein